MRYDRYDVEIGLASMTFEFVSEGPKGFIKKRVEYRVTANPNIFILSFGDVDEHNEYHDLMHLPEPHACLAAVLAPGGEHQGICTPEMARLMISRWISLVPSKIV